MPSDHPDCRDKEGYTRKEAQTKINYHRENHGRILRCYQCPNCMQWHLTHKEKYHVAKKHWELPKEKLPKYKKKSKMKPYYKKYL